MAKTVIEPFEGSAGFPLDNRVIQENEDKALDMLKKKGAHGLIITILKRTKFTPGGKKVYVDEPYSCICEYKDGLWTLKEISTVEHAVLEKDILVSENIGAIKAGETLFKGSSISSILEQILDSYKNPEISKFETLVYSDLDKKFVSTDNFDFLIGNKYKIKLNWETTDLESVASEESIALATNASLDICNMRELPNTHEIILSNINVLKPQDVWFSIKGTHKRGEFEKTAYIPFNAIHYYGELSSESIDTKVFNTFKKQSSQSLKTTLEVNKNYYGFILTVGDYIELRDTKTGSKISHVKISSITKDGITYNVFRTAEKMPDEVFIDIN